MSDASTHVKLLAPAVLLLVEVCPYAALPQVNETLCVSVGKRRCVGGLCHHGFTFPRSL